MALMGGAGPSSTGSMQHGNQSESSPMGQEKMKGTPGDKKKGATGGQTGPVGLGQKVVKSLQKMQQDPGGHNLGRSKVMVHGMARSYMYEGVSR